MRLSPDADGQHLLKQVGRQFPQFDRLLEQLRLAELEAMAKGDEKHFCTYKGRVQVLTELQQLTRS